MPQISRKIHSKIWVFQPKKDPSHLQKICCQKSSYLFEEDNSQQPQNFLHSSNEDQCLQTSFHPRSQEAKNLQPKFPLPVGHTESLRKPATKCSKKLQQTTTDIQSTPTDFVKSPSTRGVLVLSTPDKHHQLHDYYNPDKQQQLINEKHLLDLQQKQSGLTEHNSRTKNAF